MRVVTRTSSSERSARRFEGDFLNRLTGVTYADATVQSYTYQATGNRLTKTQGGSTTTYACNDGDQLTSDGTSTYTYDTNGNLTDDADRGNSRAPAVGLTLRAARR